LIPEKLDEPYRWTKPCLVFVDSMFDLFHKAIPDDYIARVFDVMAQTPHTYQVLTKRAMRMREWFESGAAERVGAYCEDNGIVWPLKNVILLVSVESQEYVDKRVPDLLSTPAFYRGISAEPLIDRITLRRVECPGDMDPEDQYCMTCDAKAECPEATGYEEMCSNGFFDALQEGIDWVIVGCESGIGSRPMDTDWVRDLRNECVSSGIPFFYKQQRNAEGKVVKLPLLDGCSYEEYPL
jgi:protein gp37